MRFLSSEGWKEKSKPASVLMVESRAMHEGGLDAAVLAQRQFLGEQRVDRLDGGRSRPARCRRSVTSRISIARGIFETDQGVS